MLCRAVLSVMPDTEVRQFARQQYCPNCRGAIEHRFDTVSRHDGVDHFEASGNFGALGPSDEWMIWNGRVRQVSTNREILGA